MARSSGGLTRNLNSSDLQTLNSGIPVYSIFTHKWFCPNTEWGQNTNSIDNVCYFILTTTQYYVIDLQTQTILLEGKSEIGMYPLQFGKETHRGSKAFSTVLGIKTSSLVWHFRLRRPSSKIVSRLVKKNELTLSYSDLNTIVCASCQLG